MAAANDTVVRLTHTMASVDRGGYFGHVTENHVYECVQYFLCNKQGHIARDCQIVEKPRYSPGNVKAMQERQVDAYEC